MALNATRAFRRESKILWRVRHKSGSSVYREDEDDKSRYQRDEEGKKPRIIHGQEYPDWRKPWGDRKGEFFSAFKPFISEENPRTDLLNGMSKIPDITWQNVKDWWREMKELNEIENQKFINERIERLGSNLGAAHFFLYRKASIRWRGNKTWIKGYITDPNTDLKLPTQFEEGYFVEAIDASTFHNGGIRFEGLENLMGLNFLKWLSLRNNKFIDEWGMDRIAGMLSSVLEYLDLSGCKVNRGCVIALSRMQALRVLVITDPGDNKDLEAALADLEDVNPNLLIKYVDEVQSANVA